MAADHQQERLEPDWVVGFTEGEGCFRVSINRQPKMSTGWQVLPEFRLVQHKRNKATLQKLQKFFGAGSVVVNHGTRLELRIRKLDDLMKAVAFFERHNFHTTKQSDFRIFAQILSMMESREHLTHEGLAKIAKLAWKINRKIKPAYLESSETIRQKPN